MDLLHSRQGESREEAATLRSLLVRKQRHFGVNVGNVFKRLPIQRPLHVTLHETDESIAGRNHHLNKCKHLIKVYKATEHKIGHPPVAALDLDARGPQQPTIAIVAK